MQLNTLLYFIVYFYRDNAQLKVIAPELADSLFTSAVPGQANYWN